MPTKARQDKLKRVAAARQSGLTVVLEDVFDPHNLGAISRSCDAFGIQDIHVIFEQQPAFDPKQVGKNSSTSTNKWLRYHIHRSSETTLRSLQAQGWTLVATAPEASAQPLFSADLCHQKTALLLGNERAGLSPRALELADLRIAIPMQGIAQSLNVSVTAALLIYEVTRQRRRHCPQALHAPPAEAARTYRYLLDMHEHWRRRNKRSRQLRARQRQEPSP